MDISRFRGIRPNIRTTQTNATQTVQKAPQRQSPFQANTFTQGSTTPAQTKRPGVTRDLSARLTQQAPTPQGSTLSNAIAQNGLRTNQDMINHCYRQGGGNWAGAQEVAKSLGLDLNDLVKDRQGAIGGGGQATPAPGGTTPAAPGPGGATPAAPAPGGTTPAPGGVEGPAATTPAAPTGNAGQDILNAARDELALGVRENAGSNEDREGHIRKYRNAVTTLAHNRGPEAWCADFVSYAAKQAGVPLGPNGQGFASVSAMRDWMQESGRFHTGNPQPGDVVFFNWDGGRPDHVGIVESVNADGTVNTIEGNTGGPGGQGLHRRNRNPGTIVGYGRM